MQYIWMAVKADEYELPLCVADTAKELGKHYGIAKETIISAEHRKISGARTGRKYVKVTIDDD